MSRRQKGFDPLASLFEQSTDREDTTSSGQADRRSARPVLEVTDPFFSGPVGAVRSPSIAPARQPRHRPAPPPELLEVPEASFLPQGEVDELPILPAEEREDLPEVSTPEVSVTSPTPQEPDPRPNPTLYPVEEHVEPRVIPPPPVLPPAEPLPPPRAPEPAQVAPPPADPVAIARALGRAAAAKAGPPRPAPHAVEKSVPKAPERRTTRAEAMSRPPARPMSAQEAIAQALREEREAEAGSHDRREARGARTPEPELPPLAQEVQNLLVEKLRGLGPLRVPNCIQITEREVLRALWRAHRARFAADGHLDQVVASLAVLRALDQVPDGRLVAAHVLTEQTDFLVWMDLNDGLPLAAFPDAKAYFVKRS